MSTTKDLIRIPLILSTALAFHVSMTPAGDGEMYTIGGPQEGEKEERTRMGSSARFVVLALTKGIYLATTLSEISSYLPLHLPLRLTNPTSLPSLITCPISLPSLTTLPTTLPSVNTIKASLPSLTTILTALHTHTPFLTLAGTTLAITGTLLRLSAQRTLGRFYAHSRQRPGHALMTDGPYAVVRHPGYLGLAMCTIGVVMVQVGCAEKISMGMGMLDGTPSSLSPVWIAVAGAVVATVGALRRIEGEEEVLREKFKIQWDEYAATGCIDHFEILPSLIPLACWDARERRTIYIIDISITDRDATQVVYTAFPFSWTHAKQRHGCFKVLEGQNPPTSSGRDPPSSSYRGTQSHPPSEMPLEPQPPSSPRGKNTAGVKHICSPSLPCDLLLSDIGKRFHAFPRGTFRLKYSPPAIPPYVLRHFAAHPFTWTWTTKSGPNQGKSFQVPTVPISCEAGSSKPLRWVVSLFHSFKAHLGPQATDGDSGKVLTPYVRLYQNNMLLHFRMQLRRYQLTTGAKDKAPSQAPAAPPSPRQPPTALEPSLRKEVADLREAVALLQQELADLKSLYHGASSFPPSPCTAPTAVPVHPPPSPTPSLSSVQSRSAPPSIPWLQHFLDHAHCPPFLHHVDSAMTPIYSSFMPEDVPQTAELLFTDGPPLSVGLDSNGDLCVSNFVAGLQTSISLSVPGIPRPWTYPFLPTH